MCQKRSRARWWIASIASFALVGLLTGGVRADDREGPKLSPILPRGVGGHAEAPVKIPVSGSGVAAVDGPQGLRGAALNGVAEYEVDGLGLYYVITGGKFVNGQTVNGDNASGGVFRFLLDDPTGGYPLFQWNRDDWFPENAGLALTLMDGASIVYDNNGIETHTTGGFYDDSATSIAGLYMGYAMSNNHDWVYAGYFKLSGPTTFDKIIGYFDGTGYYGNFDPSSPAIGYRMNIFSSYYDNQYPMPAYTASFDGDVFSSDETPGTFTWSDTGEVRVYSGWAPGTTDPIYRLEYTLDTPMTLGAGEYFFSHDAAILPPSEVWVDDDYCDTCPNDGHVWNYDAFDNIQAGVDAVVGSTVNVAPGTYEQQIVITNDNVHIIGSGSGTNPAEDTIIQSPVSLAWSFSTGAVNYPIIGHDGVTGGSIENLRVDGLGRGNGNYRFIGIAFWNAGGAVIDCVVTGVRNTPLDGSQHGNGIYAYNDTGGPYTINLSGVEVLDYQKNGITLLGEGLTVDVEDCTATGAGPLGTGLPAQNGIQIGYGAGGSVTGCAISNHMYTGGSWAATGLLLYDGTSVAVSGTQLLDNQPSVYCIDTDASFLQLGVKHSAPEAGDGFYGYSSTSAKAQNVSHSRLAAAPLDPQFAGRAKGLRAAMTITVENSSFVGADVADSWGIGAYADGTDAVQMTVTSSTVQDWDYGIVAFESAGPATITANYNAIVSNVSAGFANTFASTVMDATNNWWGDATGPMDTNGVDEAGSLPCFDPATMVNNDGLGDAVSDANVNYCPWLAAPAALTLNPDATCITTVGNTLTVTIDVTDLTTYIVGGQFFLSYDNTKLDFVSAVAGDALFTELYEQVDEPAGTINYAVNATSGDPGTDADVTLAILEFQTLDEVCSTTGLVSFRANVPPTRLTRLGGADVQPMLNNLAAISIDETAPMISTPAADETVECDGAGNTTELDDWLANYGNAVATDNCGNVTWTNDFGMLTDECAATGEVTVIFTATDDCGLSTSTTAKFTIEDTTDPVITCPADVTIECDESTDPSNTGDATAMDTCGAAPVVSYADVITPGGCADEETITRAWTATDACGNSATCDQIITVEDTIAPVLSGCPADITVPADAGGCDAVVTYAEPTATDNCDGAPVVACDWPSGSTFPQGTTAVTCTATDACGNVSSCGFNVIVDAVNELAVSVELEGVAIVAFDRCITFELTDCSGSTTTVDEVMTFNNRFATATIDVDCGAYTCIMARDKLHTLRRTQVLNISGTQYVANFSGPAALVGGNFNDDPYIDILDFGVYSMQYNMPLSADTNCSTPAPHANANGDSIVGTADFTFVQTNFLEFSDPACCAVKAMADGGPVTTITIAELQRRGLGDLAVADLNADGVLDQMDIVAFMQGTRPQPLPQPGLQTRPNTRKPNNTLGGRVQMNRR